MYLVKPSVLQGEIQIPPSKSHSLRAILFGALGTGKTTIHDYLPSPDVASMIQACLALGCKIKCHDRSLEIEGLAGKIQGAEDVIHAGNSGIVLRFITAIAALGSEPLLITGDASIRSQRSMQPLLDALQQLNVHARAARGNGYAPLIIEGPLKGGFTRVLGEDSQHVSSLLITAALAPGSTEIEVLNPGEKPWVGLTLDWLTRLRIPYENADFKHFWLKGNHRYPGFSYTVPGDLSSLAFPVVAALVTHSEILVQQVDMSDCQGDKKLFDILKEMGACIEVNAAAKTLKVQKGNPLKGIDVDINDCVDAVTILAVAACFAEGTTVLRNAEVVRHKECNRLACTVQELRKMGAQIQEMPDGLKIEGRLLHGARVFSHHDHRMAMSLTVAALGAQGETIIEETECISKTFPGFQADFAKLGASIEVIA
jgi:3-phosphoshikimate 1-carboxyvinyltransferase